MTHQQIRRLIFIDGFTSAAAIYLRTTFEVVSSGGIINYDNLFFMISARRGGQVSSTSGKLNFGVGTWGGGDEPSGYGRL